MQDTGLNAQDLPALTDKTASRALAGPGGVHSMVVEGLDLGEIAEYDARLAAMLANKNNGNEPLSSHLQHFFRLEAANTRQHRKLAEDYALKVLDWTDDEDIVSKLRESIVVDGLWLFKDRDAQEVIRELRQELAGLNGQSGFFEGVLMEWERLAAIDYSEIANPDFGGFMGKQKNVVFPSMLQRYVIDRLEARRHLGAYLPLGSGKSAIPILAGERLLKRKPEGKVVLVGTRASYDEFLKGIRGSERERYLARVPRNYFFGESGGLDVGRFRESEFAAISFEYLRARRGASGKTAADILLEEPWDLMAVDEPHVLVTDSSKKAGDLMGLLEKAETEDRYSIQLTGTISRPNKESLTTQVRFLDRKVGERIRDGGVTQEELLDLADRKAIIVGGERPLEQGVVEFDLPPEMEMVYRSLASDGRRWHKMNRFLVDFASVDPAFGEVENQKLDYIVRQLRGWKRRGEKFLVYFPYTKGFLVQDEGYCLAQEIVRRLGEDGKKVEVYDLTNKPSMYRYWIFDKIRNGADGGILPDRSCSHALNLQVCRHILIPTPTDNPTLLLQLQGRINRQGQSDETDLQVLVWKNTVEEERLATLKKRMKDAKMLKYFVIPEGFGEFRLPPRRNSKSGYKGPVRSRTETPETDLQRGLDLINNLELQECGMEVEEYLRAVDGHGLLTAEEEVALGRAVKAGDKAARERMVSANQGLVGWMARKYIYSGLPSDDLEQEGNLGLLKAIEKFDPELGYRFSTYATWWIRSTISRAIKNSVNTIRVPEDRADQVNKWKEAANFLRNGLGREPTDQEIAEHLGIALDKTERISGAADLMDGELSLDYAAPDGDRFSSTIEDRTVQDPEDEVDRMEAVGRLGEAIDKIPRKDYRAVLRLRYGIGQDRQWSLEDVGNLFGVTRECIRLYQLEAEKELHGILNGEIRPAVGETEQVDSEETADTEHAQIIPKTRLVYKGSAPIKTIEALKIIADLSNDETVSIENVVDRLSDKSGVSVEEILGKSRRTYTTYLRQGLAYLYREVIGLSGSDTAQLIGRTQSAVSDSVISMERRLKARGYVKADVDKQDAAPVKPAESAVEIPDVIYTGVQIVVGEKEVENETGSAKQESSQKKGRVFGIRARISRPKGGVSGVDGHDENVLNVLEFVSMLSRDEDITVDNVAGKMSEISGVSLDEMLGKSRRAEVAYVRHGLAYLYKEVFGLVTPRIGMVLNRDHSTIIHAVKKIQEGLQLHGYVQTPVDREAGVVDVDNNIGAYGDGDRIEPEKVEAYTSVVKGVGDMPAVQKKRHRRAFFGRGRRRSGLTQKPGYKVLIPDYIERPGEPLVITGNGGDVYRRVAMQVRLDPNIRQANWAAETLRRFDKINRGDYRLEGGGEQPARSEQSSGTAPLPEVGEQKPTDKIRMRYFVVASDEKKYFDEPEQVDVYVTALLKKGIPPHKIKTYGENGDVFELKLFGVQVEV